MVENDSQNLENDKKPEEMEVDVPAVETTKVFTIESILLKNKIIWFVKLVLKTKIILSDGSSRHILYINFLN